MARKMNALKPVQEFGRQAEVINRRSALQMTPYLVPFQPQTRIYHPKRRLEITIEVKPGMEVPSPVKIIHTV